MVSPASAENIAFGEFEAKLGSRELCRKGVKVRLPDQSFHILVMLLERRGELVTREQIRQRLWPGDTFVDFDHGLNNAVNRLREALGDSADSPQFIETLHRRGYRFIGSINGSFLLNVAETIANVTGKRLEDEQIPAAGVRVAKSPWLGRYRWALLALLITTVILAIASRLLDRRNAPSSRSFVLPPEGTRFNLTGDNGGSVALSPDGSKLAFVAINAKGEAQIWVRPLGSLRAEVVIGSEGATFPFWSHDGESLGFFAEGKLKKISRHGGTPVVLCDAPFGRGGSWNRNGVIIFAPASHTAIYRVAETGGTPEQITAVNSAIHTTHRWPRFLPDGDHFLYIAATHAREGPNGRSGTRNGIYVSSLDGKENKFLIATDADATFASGYLFFLQGDTLMAQPFDPNRAELRGQAIPTVEKVLYDQTIWKVVFDASNDALMAYETGDHVTGMQYLWYDRAGNEIGALFDRGYHIEPNFSPDGNRLADSLGMTKGDVWVHDLSRGVSTQVTSDADQNSSPIWSRDGERLFFACKTQHYNLCSVDLSGARPKQIVLDTGVDIWPIALSADGRFLLYGQGLNIGRARSQLWVYPSGGQPFRLLKGDAIEADGQFSPNGHWVVYTSNQTGRDEVYVGEFLPPASRATHESAVGQRWQVSISGGHSPRWNRNGKEIFYISSDNTVIAVPITKTGSTLEVGTAHTLFRADPDPSIGIPYDVSPDGRRFLINTAPPEKAAPITLVENWLSDLKEH